MRTRSCRSATRRRGRTQGRGSAWRRTRAPSACSTRATRSAKSRWRALPLAAQQVELDLTACGRCGPRRVGRAWRGGAELWCWAVARGGGPPPRARTSLPRLHMRLELRRHPWHWGTSLLGKTSDRRDAQRPWSDPPHRDGGRCVTHWRSDGTPPPGAGAPEREGVLLVSLQGGDKTRMIRGVPPEAESGAQAAFLPLRP